MKHELEHVRNLARDRIESGVLPERSWDRYVKLMEAAEAVLHELAVHATPADSASSHRLRRRTADQSAQDLCDEAAIAPQYQRRVYSLKPRNQTLQ